MNRIVQQFELLKEKRKKGWTKIYVAVDLHETVVLPTWTTGLSTTFYEHAEVVLRLLTEDPEVCLIMWSCSLPEVNREYSEFFRGKGINFDYINENPECGSTPYADFESKLYFSVGIDDKFGFVPEEDWLEIRELFRDRQLQRYKNKYV